MFIRPSPSDEDVLRLEALYRLASYLESRVPADVSAFHTNYVPSSDGQRFLLNTQIEQPPTPITVVLNWMAGLKK